MDIYILQSYVMQSYSWLSRTSPLRIKWIYHTSWTCSSRLSHLLRTYIYGPPNWSIHCKVFIVNICNISPPFNPRICFYVNSFKWSLHIDISECYISYTTTSFMWRNTSYTHSNSKSHFNILYKHISCTIIVMTRFWDNNIIKILNR